MLYLYHKIKWNIRRKHEVFPVEKWTDLRGRKWTLF